ncbi:hypothetical protein ABVK25_004099 [Lepraria finkii]|uniref:Secreted protein n=1 Tax=Lepraria finkii TaxID=1340010 RepID=A0ABR4BDN6_9LECA
MIYSAAAAVHAIVLFALSSTVFPAEDVLKDIYNSVLVGGKASFGDTPEGIALQWNYSPWYASKGKSRSTTGIQTHYGFPSSQGSDPRNRRNGISGGPFNADMVKHLEEIRR